MGNYLRFDSTLPKRINELAILMVARRWHATFVWKSHKTLALDSGLTEDILDDIARNRSAHFGDDGDRRAYNFLSELLDDKQISDQTWSDAIDQFGDQGVVDLLGITGYYTMVVMTVIATNFGAELPDPSMEDHGATDSSPHCHYY